MADSNNDLTASIVQAIAGMDRAKAALNPVRGMAGDPATGGAVVNSASNATGGDIVIRAPIYVQGVQNVAEMLDELQLEARRRGIKLGARLGT